MILQEVAYNINRSIQQNSHLKVGHDPTIYCLLAFLRVNLIMVKIPSQMFHVPKSRKTFEKDDVIFAQVKPLNAKLHLVVTKDI